MLQRDLSFLNIDKENILSVVLMADSFFYSLYDQEYRLLGHKSYLQIEYSQESSIQKILDDSMLGSSFSKISVAVLTSFSSHFPAQDDDFATRLPMLELKNIKIQKVLGSQVYTYFGITPHQENLINTIFNAGKYDIHHFSNILSSYYISDVGDIFHAHIESNILYIFAQKEGQLLFYNAFTISGNNDVLYFILSIYQSIHFDPQVTPLHLSGWIAKDSALYVLLYGYIQFIIFEKHLYSSLPAAHNTQNKESYYFAHTANVICA